MNIIILLFLIYLIYFMYNYFNNNCNNNYENFENDNDFGFIITRHVNSELTNKYWINCVECIRRFYKNKIIIIDDNSNKKFLNDYGKVFENCEVINSEFPGRGELLGYYYFYHRKFFNKAVIIHDSIFFNKHINFSNITDFKYLFYHHDHSFDEDNIIIPLLKKLNKPDMLLQNYHKKNKWHLCFGVQSIITHDFLVKLQEKHNFLELINHVDTRIKRMGLERIIGFLGTLEKPELYSDSALLGNIYRYIQWGYTYKQYLANKLEKLPLIKVWTGR